MLSYHLERGHQVTINNSVLRAYLTWIVVSQGIPAEEVSPGIKNSLLSSGFVMISVVRHSRSDLLRNHHHHQKYTSFPIKWHLRLTWCTVFPAIRPFAVGELIGSPLPHHTFIGKLARLAGSIFMWTFVSSNWPISRSKSWRRLVSVNGQMTKAIVLPP